MIELLEYVRRKFLPGTAPPAWLAAVELVLTLWLEFFPLPSTPSTPSARWPPLFLRPPGPPPPDADRVDDSVSDDSVTTASLAGIVPGGGSGGGAVSPVLAKKAPDLTSDGDGGACLNERDAPNNFVLGADATRRIQRAVADPAAGWYGAAPSAAPLAWPLAYALGVSAGDETSRAWDELPSAACAACCCVVVRYDIVFFLPSDR